MVHRREYIAQPRRFVVLACQNSFVEMAQYPPKRLHSRLKTGRPTPTSRSGLEAEELHVSNEKLEMDSALGVFVESNSEP